VVVVLSPEFLGFSFCWVGEQGADAEEMLCLAAMSASLSVSLGSVNCPDLGWVELQAIALQVLLFLASMSRY
jgi:hypothetical protein